MLQLAGELYYVMSYLFMSCLVISHYVILYHITFVHVTLYYIVVFDHAIICHLPAHIITTNILRSNVTMRIMSVRTIAENCQTMFDTRPTVDCLDVDVDLHVTCFTLQGTTCSISLCERFLFKCLQNTDLLISFMIFHLIFSRFI